MTYFDLFDLIYNHTEQVGRCPTRIDVHPDDLKDIVAGQPIGTRGAMTVTMDMWRQTMCGIPSVFA